MANQQETSDLLDILRTAVIPRAEQSGAEGIVIAPSAWKPLPQLPNRMTMSRLALKGRRVKQRSDRNYGSTSSIDAVWPEDRMQSTRTPLLCFVVQGPVAYRISNYVLHCESGQGILVPPGLPFADGTHRFLDETRPHQGSCTFLQMRPYREGLICWYSQRGFDKHDRMQHNGQNSSIHGSKVSDLLYQLMENMQSPQKYQSMICASLLRLLLGTLYNELQDLPVFESGKSPRLPNAIASQSSIATVEEYIRQNLRCDLTTDKIAQRACMSRTTFTQSFRATTGKSLVQYITDLRFEKACDLLRGSDLAIGQISHAVGFEADHLRVLFHKRENVSPSQYRAKHRNSKNNR